MCLYPGLAQGYFFKVQKVDLHDVHEYKSSYQRTYMCMYPTCTCTCTCYTYALMYTMRTNTLGKHLCSVMRMQGTGKQVQQAVSLVIRSHGGG